LVQPYVPQGFRRTRQSHSTVTNLAYRVSALWIHRFADSTSLGN
jgi:hypothetical protein